MPLPYQIIPEGSLFRPKIETHINDNSEVNTETLVGGGNVTSVLAVFASPKGRDNQVVTIDGGLSQFLEEYGIGPFSLYGQPLLNAYNAARAASSSDARVHCLRVTAADASYACAALIAKYKVVQENSGSDPVLHVTFVIKGADNDAYLNGNSGDGGGLSSSGDGYGLISLKNMDNAVAVSGGPDSQGWYSAKLFTVAYRGKGSYGRNVRFRVTSNRGADKMNAYKNYNFDVLRNEGALALAESFSVTAVDGSTSGSTSLFLPDVVNDVTDGSKIVAVEAYPENFKAIFDSYVTNIDADTTYTEDDFDVLLGLDKYTRGKIAGYAIDLAGTTYTPASGETAVDIDAVTGVPLLGGSDGSLSAETAPATRNAALKQLYIDAFQGEIDPLIKSTYRFPTTFIFDANYPIEVKSALAQLVISRKDCFGVIDFGTEIETKASVKDYYDTNIDGMFNDWHLSMEPYCMKISEPYGHKSVVVTSTYWMAGAYLSHIAGYGGKHRPMAGNRFGVIDGVIKNSVYPVFDDSIDADQMDELAELKLNIAKYNQLQQCVRSMQNTTQDKLSALTEMNNALLVLDIKRECEILVSNYEYDFADPEDIVRFNTGLSSITSKYAGTQLRSISGHFEQSKWEADRSILHLYVEMVHKNLVKTVIIEVDVNRADSE